MNELLVMFQVPMRSSDIFNIVVMIVAIAIVLFLIIRFYWRIYKGLFGLFEDVRQIRKMIYDLKNDIDKQKYEVK
jgi:hypothetical protein